MRRREKAGPTIFELAYKVRCVWYGKRYENIEVEIGTPGRALLYLYIDRYVLRTSFVLWYCGIGVYNWGVPR